MLEDKDWLDKVYFPTNLQRLLSTSFHEISHCALLSLFSMFTITDSVPSDHISSLKAERGFPDSEAEIGGDERESFGCTGRPLLLG